jgi:hypothetical protein
LRGTGEHHNPSAPFGARGHRTDPSSSSSSRSGCAYRLSLATAANFPVKTLQLTTNQYVPAPYEKDNCSPCVSELDCRSLDEFCNAQGCCAKGQCSTDGDCAAMSLLDRYYTVPGFDSIGYDLNPLHPQDNQKVLRTACDVNPDCVAYTSYGMLKHTVSPVTAWIPQPSIRGLAPWIMYIKKTAINEKDPRIRMTTGVREFCQPQNDVDAQSYLNGLCRQCVTCSADTDCPDSTVCDTTSSCCVNNPCYSATSENGKWVDGHYSRDPQCDCPADKPYCCLDNSQDVHSAFCSDVPCTERRKVRACSYICESENGKYDSVMCLANQRCCNASKDPAVPGPPTCCAAGSAGSADPAPAPTTLRPT